MPIKVVSPDQWSSEGSKVKGGNKEARLINDHLDYLKNKVFEAEKRLFKKDLEVTSENLKNEIFGANDRKRMLIPIFQDHNNKIKELVGKEYAPGTLERYKTSLKHTEEFLQWKYQISDIDIIKIDNGKNITSMLISSMLPAEKKHFSTFFIWITYTRRNTS